MMNDRHFFPSAQILATNPFVIWKRDNMHSKLLAVLLWLTLVPFKAAFGQETPVLPVELTPASLEKFIATFPALATSFSQNDAEFDAADPDSLIGQIGLMIEGDPDDSALDKAASGQGYASFDEWGALASNILIARLWAENPPDEAEIAASEAEITALTDVSEDEKNQMIAGLHEAMGTALEEKPSEANIETVRPFLAKLSEVLGAPEEE
jgi:hypothetical protein